MPDSKKLDLSPWKNTVLLHNGAPHNLFNLLQLALAESAPTVTINLDQVGPVASDIPNNLFLIQPKNKEIDHLPLVLYKHGGRFHALVGSANLSSAKTNQLTQVTGKLLSSPALKKARIIKAEDVAPPPPASQPQRGDFQRRSQDRRY